MWRCECEVSVRWRVAGSLELEEKKHSKLAPLSTLSPRALFYATLQPYIETARSSPLNYQQRTAVHLHLHTFRTRTVVPRRRSRRLFPNTRSRCILNSWYGTSLWKKAFARVAKERERQTVLKK